MGYVLIVDDSDVIRTIVKQTLEMHNYKDILLANDGIEALKLINEYGNQIDMYILDVNMPNMDGLTLIGEIRKRYKFTPIIMLTTETEKEKIIKAKNLGATGWIVKPFDGDKFIKVVDMYLKN